MAELAPRFSSNRMLREYVEAIYLPAAAAVRRRSADGGRLARELHAWERALAAHWPEVQIGAVTAGRDGDHWRVEVEVALGAVAPEWVRVELYAEPLEDEPPVRVTMARAEGRPGGGPGAVYRARVPVSRPASDYTPRVVASHPDARVPMEAAYLRWPR
jgi:starch phosphorylase